MAIGRGNKVGITGQFDDKITGKLGKVRDQFDQLGKSKGAATVLQGVGMGMGISAWGMLSDAMAGAVSWVKEGIAGAREETANIAKLDAALRANVQGWDGNTASIERTIRAQMDLGFADDEQRDSMARLVAATHDVNKAFEIQRTAMDLARFKGVDLATATDALIKVEGGQYRALKGLGIVLREGATQTEAMAAVQKVAAGQAEAYSETEAAAAEELSIKLDELGETIGGHLVPAFNDATETAINFLDAIDDDSPMVLSDRTLALVDALSFLNPALEAGVANMKEAKTHIPTREVHRFKDAVVEVLPEIEGYSRNLNALSDDARQSRKQIDKLIDTVDEATETFLDAALGPKELRLELKNETADLQDNIEKLRELQAIKDPTREQRADIRDTKLEVIDNKREIIRTTERLEALGEVKLGSTRQQISSLIGPLDSAGDEARQLVAYMNALDNVRNPSELQHTADGGGLASGGPALPFHRYKVGEQGEETLVMGARGGYVIPNGGRAAGQSAQPAVIQLNIDGREIARVVDRHLYYEAARAPRSATA
jgi:hypothetical protein